MKTPVRFQSRLLIRRSYKPSRLGRPVRISFHSMLPVTIPVLARETGRFENHKS